MELAEVSARTRGDSLSVKLGFLQGHEDKVLGRVLSPLPAYQGAQDHQLFLGTSVEDDVSKSRPVLKQTYAGSRARPKPFVAVRDYKGHVGLGVNALRR